MKQVVIYIIGPHSASTDDGIQENVLNAVHWASKLRKKGFCCIVPHLESMFHENAIPENEWLNHGLELESRCDAVFVIPDSENSNGVKQERAFADIIKIPVFDDIQKLEDYFKNTENKEG
jgi:hypothetical protein